MGYANRPGNETDGPPVRRTSTDKRHFINVGVIVAVGTVVLYFLLIGALPMPEAASSQSATIDSLFRSHMLLIAFLFALVVGFMLYALVVFRRRKGDEGEGDHFEGNTPLEIAWTVIPLIVVIVFSYLGVVTLRDVTAAQPNEMQVDVNSFQWGWSFTYPETGVVSQELVLPVDRPAVMEMTSQDVVHSFWVPEFRVKQDLVPGQIQYLRFTPTVQGEYTLGCAEFCGLTHYNMVAPVRVVTDAEFSAWMGVQVAEQGIQVASGN